MASSKNFWLDEMLVSRLLMLSGMFFSSAGGWLPCRWTYRTLLLGFMKGLEDPLGRSRVTSRKFMVFLFASMVILRPLDLKILLPILLPPSTKKSPRASSLKTGLKFPRAEMHS